ncbi:MAG: hypothetical protein ACYCOU_00250 [Sulfobacillus sp.]
MTAIKHKAHPPVEWIPAIALSLEAGYASVAIYIQSLKRAA